MKKYADRYYKVDPWRVLEEGFCPDYSRVSESIFSLGNEFMGVRGYFEEGYTGERLQGSYVNGIYSSRPVAKSGYKGMLETTEFMVNAVDWTKVTIDINNQTLDLSTVDFEDFHRELDFRNGLLTRSFIWRVDQKTTVKLTFERFLSMTRYNIGVQRIKFDVLEGEAKLSLIAELDFDIVHESFAENFWGCCHPVSEDNKLSIVGITKETNQILKATCIFSDTGKKEEGLALNQKKVHCTFTKQLDPTRSYTWSRLARIEKIKDIQKNECVSQQEIEDFNMYDVDVLLEENRQWWMKQWKVSDITIEGDPENQQGIRFCIFQMHQTLHTADHTAVIGAKGLTGEAYNGNTFWDTEVYCLPFYLFNNPKAAKSILDFRYESLDAARERARALDLNGAFYPIATISGKECCDLWQHANLQLQASTGVMYGIWLYEKLTGDQHYLYTRGLEMLIEISRMLASRGAYNPESGGFGYYCVMGPDEFQMMVNQNVYTNYMAQKTFNYTLKTLSQLNQEDEDQYQKVVEKMDVSIEELADWKKKSEDMIILFDDETMLYEQHEGYFSLPIVQLKDIPVDDFPLYGSWTYDRIYRNSMIKQPDVLMFMLLYNSEFSTQVLKANYEFYEARCIHESSLSPSVHSILAAQLDKKEDAYNLFGFATRMDLDNYNRNTSEGLHTTSIAGSWMNIIYGFGGLRSDGVCLMINPSIPATWKGYSFNLNYRGQLISVMVNQAFVELWVDSGSVDLLLYGENIKITEVLSKYPLKGRH